MITPFNLKNIEESKSVLRSDVYPDSWDYDPISQTTNMEMMGSTSPTTMSAIASTGTFGGDSDEGSDDTGED